MVYLVHNGLQYNWKIGILPVKDLEQIPERSVNRGKCLSKMDYSPHFFFFVAFALGSFFLGKVPSKKHLISL